MEVRAPEPTRSRFPPWLVWLLFAGVAGLIIAAIIGATVNSSDRGDPGRLAEPLYDWPGSLPQFVDVTEQWGVDAWVPQPVRNLSGAVAIGDLDGDGRNDVIVASGSVAIFFGGDAGLAMAGGVDISEAVAVGLGDLDNDGILELIIGRAAATDLVVWGGTWVTDRDLSIAEITEVPSGLPSTGFAVADLNGDDINDLLRIGYGSDSAPAADVVFVHDGARSLEARELPQSRRLSLAFELGDFDRDGLIDIWITRDVGWISGGDSVYSRRGDVGGEWADVAAELGVASEIDGMGVTVADLSGDGQLDAYVSDVGENEFFVGGVEGYLAARDHGAGYIRAGEAPPTVVSSSWGTGVADFNLDGLTDLAVANGGFEGMTNKIKDTDIAISDRPALLLGLGEGRYADVWPDVAPLHPASWRGLAIGDLDSDGDSDLALLDYSGGLVIYRNDIAAPSLVVSSSCRGAGAVVRVDVAGRSLVHPLVGHTFLGRHAAEVIVGTGGATSAGVTVEWPGGATFSADVVIDGLRDSLKVPCPG
ncbi:MAG: VCBS repeat-containing protein [Acidimicrobiia bacterium]